MATENELHNIDLTAAFETEKLVLKYNFFYRNTKTKITIYNLPAIILAWSLCIVTWLPMPIEMIRRIDELGQITQITQNFVSVTCYLLKLINFHCTQHLLEPVEEILRSDVFRGKTMRQNMFLKDAITTAKYLGSVFRSVCIGILVFKTVYPYVDKNLEYPMPLPGWYPVDATKYKTALTCLQSFSLLLSTFNNAALDVLPPALMLLGSAEFDVLKDRLTTTFRDRDVSDEWILKELKKCVIHHNEIIRYVALVENMFTSAFFAQVVTSALAICLTGFEMTVTPVQSTTYIMLAIYFVALLIQVSMYCWFGQLIMFKNKELMDCCYETNWYERGTRVRKTLLIIMERSKRPVVVTAGKMFTLSLKTLGKIFRSSYSYFTVLQRIKDDINI